MSEGEQRLSCPSVSRKGKQKNTVSGQNADKYRTQYSCQVRSDTHTLQHLSLGKEMLRDKAVGSSVHTDFSTEQQNRVCLLVAGHEH